MIIYWFSRKTYRGFGYWVLANFSIGLGYVLLLLRNQIPDFFSIIVGNALTLYGLILIYDGIQLFFDRRAFNLWNHLILAAFILLQLNLTYIDPDINARIVLVSGVAFIFELRTGITLFRDSPPKFHRTCQTIAVIFIASSLISILRAVYALYQSQPIDILLDETLEALAFASICALTVWTFYFFFLNSARLEFDLKETQKNLVTNSDADRHRVFQLGLLDETSRSLAESMDESEIMQRAVKAIVKRFGYAEAAISLLVEGDNLEIAAIDGAENIGYEVGYRQKMGEGIIGHTAENQQVYISGDIEHDPYYFSIGNRSGSAVCVPMLNAGKLLGVLYVESTTLNAFYQDDIQTLDTLVRHMVTAIQKARLYARSQAHLRAISTLNSVSQTILSSLELQQIFQSVVKLLKDTFSYTYVSIYTLHGQVLRLEAQAGYPEEMIISEIPATEGIVGRSVQTKQTQFIPDVSREPAFLRAAFEIESEICVPIINVDNVLGVLNVEAAPGHSLTEDDQALLTALIGPVVIAIENAQLHAEVKQLALTDGLTHLNNRRAFDQTLEKELYRAARYNYPMSLIMIDMDSLRILMICGAIRLATND